MSVLSSRVENLNSSISMGYDDRDPVLPSLIASASVEYYAKQIKATRIHVHERICGKFPKLASFEHSALVLSEQSVGFNLREELLNV